MTKTVDAKLLNFAHFKMQEMKTNVSRDKTCTTALHFEMSPAEYLLLKYKI